MGFQDRREDSRQEAGEIFEVVTGTTTSEVGTVVEGGLSTNVVSLDHVFFFECVLMGHSNNT